MSKLKRKEAMYPLVKMYLQYKGGKKKFCKEHRIAESSFGYWITKYRKTHLKPVVKSNFVRVIPNRESIITRGLFSIRFPNGILIESDNTSMTDTFAGFLGKVYRETL